MVRSSTAAGWIGTFGSTSPLGGKSNNASRSSFPWRDMGESSSYSRAPAGALHASTAAALCSEGFYPRPTPPGSKAIAQDTASRGERRSHHEASRCSRADGSTVLTHHCRAGPTPHGAGRGPSTSVSETRSRSTRRSASARAISPSSISSSVSPSRSGRSHVAVSTNASRRRTRLRACRFFSSLTRRSSRTSPERRAAPPAARSRQGCPCPAQRLRRPR